MTGIDADALAKAFVALCTVVNTALLIWSRRTLNSVQSDVNGAKSAAVEAAHHTGYLRGLLGNKSL